MHVAQNWPNLEKSPPFLQFQNLFLVKDLTNHFLFPLIISFWEHTFLLGCDVWKMDALLQCPQGLFLSSPTFQKHFWWKLTSNSFHQKKFEKNKKQCNYVGILFHCDSCAVCTPMNMHPWSSDIFFSPFPVVKTMYLRKRQKEAFLAARFKCKWTSNGVDKINHYLLEFKSNFAMSDKLWFPFTSMQCIPLQISLVTKVIENSI